jgi:hypothetical protein
MAACLAAALGCLGQQVPTFRAGTTLVEFTVVAVDAKGEPVLDLAAREMRITEHGFLAFFSATSRSRSAWVISSCPSSTLQARPCQ